MGFTKEQMSAAFEKAAQNIPEIVAGHRLLSMGTFGLVLASDQDEITKVLFHHSEPYWNDLSQEHADNEISALSYFSEHPLSGLGTPVLLGEPQELDHSDYKAYYKMSRLPGRSMSWHPEENKLNEQTRLMRDGILAGRALARFHDQTKAVPPATFREANPIKIGFIPQIESLPAFMNAALGEADAYLQDKKTMGIVHGDFHGGNIMVGDNNQLSGLIDFGFTGYANLYYDFIKAKPYFMPGLIEGYEIETGEAVDRKLIAATILGRYTNRLIKLETDHPDTGFDDANPERMKVISTMVDCLKTMQLYEPPL